MSSITKIAERKYRVRWRSPNGGSRTATFSTRAAAEAHRTKIDHEKLSGSYVDRSAGKITLRSYVAEHLERQPWRARTRAAANTSLAHALAVFGDRPLSSIRPSDVQAFASGLSLAPSTVATVMQHLRTVLRSAVRDGLIARDPSAGVKLPRVTTGAIVPPDDGAVQAIYEAAIEPFKIAVVLGAAIGLRQGEAAGLTADRIDWLRRTVHIDRQWSQAGGWSPPKTRASIRTVPVAAEVLEMLARRIELCGLGSEGVLVHWRHSGGDGPMHHTAWARVMRQAVADAGLTSVRYHDLRHHYASRLIAAGCSVKAVQSALGHEKAGTTLDTYGHLWPGDEERIRAAVARAWVAPVSPRCQESAGS